MDIQNLVLEITRRCNMHCAHCQRGEAEDKDMDFAVIDRILELADSVQSVTFTGGEPSLYIPAIRYFFEKAKALGKMPYWFYVVTNGKENQLELAVELLKVYPEMEEQEFCGIALSVDTFHEKHQDFLVKGLAFYCTDKEDPEMIPISEGRAFSLPKSRFRTKHPEITADGQTIEMLYVSVDGDLVGDCDLSYKHIEQMSRHNLFQIESLNEVIEEEMQ